ncbi:uncharacterized protein N0V89_011817 [Didymosphaeria variabile]|uniref:Uncharacterized protein n=1 Tax=Didymosphaeria variabile TaxID=1932322 RepID=A0A9W8XAF8_9PLEO|nr:uncharacterized protein N0V89_011817 [Didymosphaeria variabile]KAJ4345682.1 hypothetical protein N0V89_011817 [Didymosphaeria variabile]
MDQDYELIVAAGLHTPPQAAVPRCKSVLLLYDCSSIPIPDLAYKLGNLGHVVVLPAMTAPDPAYQGRTYFYEADEPFARPKPKTETAILDFAHQRTGKRGLFTIIVLGPPQVQDAHRLPSLLVDWSGFSFNLVSEAHRRGPREHWRACFERYEDALERRRNGVDWYTYHLDALNGIRGISWKDVDEPNVDRAADERRNLESHLLLQATVLHRPVAMSHLRSRISRLTGLRASDPCLDNSDRLFLCFSSLRRWELGLERPSELP